jgi:hypothetical protein
MYPSRGLFMTGLFWVAITAAARAETILPIPNGGFEEGLKDWKISEKEPMTTLTTEQVGSGKYALKIDDHSTKEGCSAQSLPVAIEKGKSYELHGQALVVAGSGLGLYVQFLDRSGKPLSDNVLLTLNYKSGKWAPFVYRIYPTDNTAALRLWIHSFAAAQVKAYLDDLEFREIPAERCRPPWPGQYKIDPQQMTRLTPADVVGPDGIVYPDWSRAGLQNTAAPPATTVKIEDFGARANDDSDAAPALDRACRVVGEKGGGVVQLAEGTYQLDWPVTIRHDQVVIRGQGPTKTHLVFRYAIPKEGVGFYQLQPGSRIGKNTRIEIHCLPTGLKTMKIQVDDRVLYQWQRSQHSGNTFSCSAMGQAVVGKLPDGPHVLAGFAEYDQGPPRHNQIPIVLDSKFQDQRLVPNSQVALCFRLVNRIRG